MKIEAPVIRLIRITTAIVIVAVLGMQLSNVVRHGVDPWNFVSYFTIWSGLGSAAVLGYLAWRPGQIDSGVVAIFRGSVTVSMCMTALLYGFWISPSFGDAARHLIGPVVLVTDWVLYPSPRTGPVRTVVGWMTLPVAYMVYTLVRGYVFDWYPYGFLDPAGEGGLVRFVGFCGVLFVILVVTALVLRAWTRIRPTIPVGAVELVESDAVEHRAGVSDQLTLDKGLRPPAGRGRGSPGPTRTPSESLVRR